MNKDSQAAIIMNDLDSIAYRIEALDAHPEFTEALLAVQKAHKALSRGRSDIHHRDMQARFEKADA